MMLTGPSICVISVVRTITLVHISYLDITHSVPTALIWSMLEPTLGVTIACVPVMRPMLVSFLPSIKGSSNKSGSSAGGFDPRNFQNIDEQQLYPLGNVRKQSRRDPVDLDTEAEHSDLNGSEDAINFRTA